jgi:hypothetical protein
MITSHAATSSRRPDWGTRELEAKADMVRRRLARTLDALRGRSLSIRRRPKVALVVAASTLGLLAVVIGAAVDHARRARAGRGAIRVVLERPSLTRVLLEKALTAAFAVAVTTVAKTYAEHALAPAAAPAFRVVARVPDPFPTTRTPT